jgi:1-aminocyclopropane-1-carboxylate deaminase/D-cysteine desulfhydrase-like pyridoxal-dependent ACC family enzyme
MNDLVKEAIREAAQREGLLLDPVYTGRSLAGLIMRVREGVIPAGSTVLFIHTGGLPGLFGYQSDLTMMLET